MIITALSDPFILTESGFHEYAKWVCRKKSSESGVADPVHGWLTLTLIFFFFKRLRSIGFSEECMGLHYGNIHRADLGDGDGQKNEQFLARQYYFPVWGSCWESVAGASLFFTLHFAPFPSIVRFGDFESLSAVLRPERSRRSEMLCET